MINIKVRKSVIAKNVPLLILSKCKEDLIFNNPVYKDAEKHGRTIPSDLQTHLIFYKHDRKKKTFKFPKGYLYFFKKKLDKYGYEYTIEDKTLTLAKEDFKFYGTLRDYQKSAVKDCLSYPCSVLEAGTGSGKTIMGIAMIVKRRQPTLILVHTKELLYQWEKRIKKFMKYSPGLIGDGHFNVKPVTIGIINSIKNHTDIIKKNFGHIIFDEVHRCPANMWIYAIKKFPAKYLLGLSATMFRRDGLGQAIHIFIGPKMHKVDGRELTREGAILSPKIIKLITKFRFYYRGNYTSLISALCKNYARNELIAKAVMNDWNENKQNILVVSDRVSHCNLLYDAITKLGGKASLVHGGVKPDKRKSIIENVNRGKVNILIATTQLIGEGFDAPNLTTLFLTTPIKFKGRLIQVIGRILRPEEGKKPRVYDVVDEDVRILLNAWFTRAQIYKKEWR